MKKMLNSGWDNLSIFYKGKILDFTNQIIGMQLSEKNNIRLEYLLSKKALSCDNSNSEIIENSKQLALKYKKSDTRNITKKTIN